MEFTNKKLVSRLKKETISDIKLASRAKGRQACYFPIQPIQLEAPTSRGRRENGGAFIVFLSLVNKDKL